MTFNEIWDEYIANKRIRVKPSTVSAYTCTWKSLKRDFGDREISSITTKGVEKWAIAQLSQLSRKSVKDRIILLNNIIDYYIYEYETPAQRINMKYIHWPTANVQEGELEAVKTFTPQEISVLVTHIAQDPTSTNLLVAIMIATGIRIGEACALTYGDVNTDNGTVEIRRTLERIMIDAGYTSEDLDKMNVNVISRARSTALVMSPPKCRASYRAVPVPRELLKVLKAFKTIYPGEYYIGSNCKKPMEPRVMRGHYRRLLEDAGIGRWLSPHSLRHTYATNLITTGVDVKTAAALLGHGDTSTTLAIYSHATSESKKKAMTTAIGKQFKNYLGKNKTVK